LFKKKHSDFRSESLSKQTWIRFKRNKLAMFGLTLIIAATLISILGFLITPDSSPYANDQKPELHIKKPGFDAKMLLVKKNENSHKTNWFSKMIFGEVSDYASVPIYSYAFKGFDVVIEEYTGNVPNNGSKVAFNVADVVYDANNNYPIKNDTATNTIVFYQLSTGEKLNVSVSELQNSITKDYIKDKNYILGTDLAGNFLIRWAHFSYYFHCDRCFIRCHSRLFQRLDR
jgi:peptide/nickel transport system permease protein